MFEPFDLAELQALPIPRCSLEHAHGEGVTEEMLSPFLPPRINKTNDGVLCVGCGETLWRPGIVGFLMGATFTWGVAHGEGRCSSCGYPTRMYHRRAEGTATFPLQYHPDDLRLREKTA